MSALPVARLFGFEIRVHVSWAIILAAITVSVAGRIEAFEPATSAALRWGVGAAVAAGFLVSALAHELGHALVARRAGLPGGPVVVYFFGGAASPVLEAVRPRDEVAVALAGPVVSLAIGVAMLATAGFALGAGGGPATAVGEVALVIGVLDLILGGVNLVPAFPLDGGRVARGVAWARTGDPTRALRIVAGLGRWIGVGLAIAGTILILTTDSVDGLMLALCGWFLVSSGRQVERTADVERLLEGIRVGDIMEREPDRVPAGLTLDTFADQVLASQAGAVSVVRGTDVVGTLGARQLRRVRRDRWPRTRAGDLMTPREDLPTILPETTVRAALEHLQRSGLDGLPVTVGGSMTAIVTRRAIAQAIRDRRRAPGVVR